MVAWNRSILPFVDGWYAVVRILLIARSLYRSRKRSLSKWVPLSVRICSGQLCMQMTRANRILVTVTAS